MKAVLVPLAALYAVLAASSAAAVAALGLSWYGMGVLWIAVTGVTQFFFAFALEKRRPKAFVWVVLGGVLMLVFVVVPPGVLGTGLSVCWVHGVCLMVFAWGVS